MERKEGNRQATGEDKNYDDYNNSSRAFARINSKSSARSHGSSNVKIANKSFRTTRDYKASNDSFLPMVQIRGYGDGGDDAGCETGRALETL